MFNHKDLWVTNSLILLSSWCNLNISIFFFGRPFSIVLFSLKLPWLVHNIPIILKNQILTYFMLFFIFEKILQHSLPYKTTDSTLEYRTIFFLPIESTVSYYFYWLYEDIFPDDNLLFVIGFSFSILCYKTSKLKKNMYLCIVVSQIRN